LKDFKSTLTFPYVVLTILGLLFETPLKFEGGFILVRDLPSTKDEDLLKYTYYESYPGFGMLETEATVISFS